MNIFTPIQDIVIQGGIALLICVILLIASAVIVIYMDSLANCWRYVVRDIETQSKLLTQEEITLEHKAIDYPFMGWIVTHPSIQLLAFVYFAWLLLGIIPLVNTFLLIHSALPFFGILKKIRKNPHLKMHYRNAKHYLNNNPEVKSKFYHSFMLQLILKYGFMVKKPTFLFS